MIFGVARQAARSSAPQGLGMGSFCFEPFIETHGDGMRFVLPRPLLDYMARCPTKSCITWHSEVGELLVVAMLERCHAPCPRISS